jgi:hypothetical protein
MTNLNPVGAIEPMHVGQMFLDHESEAFYQARGKTAADWQIVHPDDMIGSFVKVYDHFFGLPQNDPQGPEGARIVTEANIVKQTMMLDGVHVLQAFAWKTHDDTEVMVVRLKFERVKDLLLFVGYARDTRAHAMPQGVGMVIENGAVTFGFGEGVSVRKGETVAFRVSISGCWVEARVREQPIAQSVEDDPAARRPVVALLNLGPGPRPHAPNYGPVLQRKLRE